MKTRTTTIRALLLATAAAAVLTACSVTSAAGPSAPAAPSVDEARATEIATNALRALNEGDYAGWSRDWSQTMKDAIREPDFLEFRESVMSARGRATGIQGVRVTSLKPGTYRYIVTVSFERGTGNFGFGFVEGGSLVEGVHYE